MQRLAFLVIASIASAWLALTSGVLDSLFVELAGPPRASSETNTGKVGPPPLRPRALLGATELPYAAVPRPEEAVVRFAADKVPEQLGSQLPVPREVPRESAEQSRLEVPAELVVAAQLQLLEENLVKRPASGGWDVAAAELLAGAFSRSFQGGQMDAPECGAQVCRVVVRFSPESDVSGAVYLAADQVPWNAEIFVHSEEVDGQPMAYLYVAREGKRLPVASGVRP